MYTATTNNYLFVKYPYITDNWIVMNVTGGTIGCGEDVTIEASNIFTVDELISCGGKDFTSDEGPTDFISYGICPTPTPTPTSSVTPSITPSVTSTVTPSVTTTPSVTNTPSVTTTPSVTITPSVTTTPSVTITPTITPTSSTTPSITPTSTITPTPSVTVTPSITPTPSASVPAFDADALAYLEDVSLSGGTTGTTINDAVNTLFTDLKSNGLYSKMLAMYPFVGGTAASHAIEAKLDKSFDITWNGGMTHGISGSTGDGVNGYGNTNFGMDDFTNKQLSSFGLYLTQPQTNSGSQRLHGTFDGSRIAIGTNAGGKGYFGFYSVQYNSTQPTEQTGIYSIVRTGTTEAPVYINENTTPFTTLTGSYNGNQPTDPVYIFAFNVNGSPLNNGYTEDTLGFCYFGEGLDYSETLTLQGIINDFQTALGRNAYT